MPTPIEEIYAARLLSTFDAPIADKSNSMPALSDADFGRVSLSFEDLAHILMPPGAVIRRWTLPPWLPEFLSGCLAGCLASTLLR